MRNNKGFSLVELIVVIAIMAILAAVAVASFSIYIKKAQEANDEEYRSNVEYFALLEATEHQFNLYDVVISDSGVSGPQDIHLMVEESNGQIVESTYEDEAYAQIILDIFNAVGDWTFSDACNHANGTITQIEANCKEPAHNWYSCCEKVVYTSTEVDLSKHPKPNDTVIQNADKDEDGYYVVVCELCGIPVPYAMNEWGGFVAVGDKTGNK